MEISLKKSTRRRTGSCSTVAGCGGIRCRVVWLQGTAAMLAWGREIQAGAKLLRLAWRRPDPAVVICGGTGSNMLLQLAAPRPFDVIPVPRRTHIKVLVTGSSSGHAPPRQ